MPSARHFSTRALLLVLLLSGVAPAQDPLLPVVSRVQLLFSLVSHPNHDPATINFYHQYGIPKGNENYAVPYLVCDPLITLYNPHDQPLVLDRLRVKIWDPPVGFKFLKNSIELRPEGSEEGGFYGLARFQEANAGNPEARKSFTLVLGDSAGSPDLPIETTVSLAPGESKFFGPKVTNSWTWGMETAGGNTPHAFRDHDVAADVTNRDLRTNNNYGFEMIHTPSPGFGAWNPKAGFRVNFLSWSGPDRPDATLYSFELANNRRSGEPTIKLSDIFYVQAKALRTAPPSPGIPAFSFSVHAGPDLHPQGSVLRSFSFDLGEINPRLLAPGFTVYRAFRVQDLLQRPTDRHSGGKSPFLVLSASAKNHALTRRLFFDSATPDSDLYDITLDEVVDFFYFDWLYHPNPPPPEPVVHSTRRSGDSLIIDLEWGALIDDWRVMGTTNPELGFHEDLAARAVVKESPYGTGLYRAVIDVAGLGPRYYVRLEK